jgi:hypothetical protein
LSSKRAVAILWACFCIRALFYSTALPLWEGFDEYSHFAYVQHVAAEWKLPMRNAAVPREVGESLQRVPVSIELAQHLPGVATTYDTYWQLKPAEREVFHKRPVKNISLRLYEAQQPPLYYSLMAIPYATISGLSLIERVWILRILNVLIASLAIPATYALARRILQQDALAIGGACVVASMPELYITVCRVTNEALAIACGSVMLVLTVAASRQLDTQRACGLGVTLGLALLTKAYFLSPATAAIGLLLCSAERQWRRITIAVCFAIVIGGWWYVSTYLQTGSLSGEQGDVAAQRLGIVGIIAALPKVEWLRAIDSTFVSHIWFGGWSFLSVRSWMYHFFAIVFLGATVGLVKVRRVRVLIVMFAALLAALAYHVTVNSMVHGKSVTTGWYLYALVAAEAVLLIAGLREVVPQRLRSYIPFALCFCLTAVEFFGLHFYQLPYYTGFTRHNATGGLPALHLDQLLNGGLGELIHRLAINKPAWISPVLVAMLWLAFLIATFAVLWVAFRQALLPKSENALSHRCPLR